jgi:peptide/nickel transport system permease protein
MRLGDRPIGGYGYGYGYGASLGALIVLLFVASAIAPRLFSPLDPLAFNPDAILQSPSFTYPFGTDNLGRCVLSRVIWGARADILFPIYAAILPAGFGAAIGGIAGYYGRWAGTALDFVTEICLTLPLLVIIMVIVAAVGQSLHSALLAIGLVSMIVYARMMSQEMRRVCLAGYVEAARALGYSDSRVIFRHALPNALPPFFAFVIMNMGSAILVGAALGFLGLGAQPPTPEWGTMIAEGQAFIFSAWWMSLGPGFALMLVGLAFGLLGNQILKRR